MYSINYKKIADKLFYYKRPLSLKKGSGLIIMTIKKIYDNINTLDCPDNRRRGIIKGK